MDGNVDFAIYLTKVSHDSLCSSQKRRIGNLYKKYGLGGGEEDLGVAVGFAKELYEQYIINPTADLLEQYPKDHKDEDGFDFWGGKRRR